MKNNTIGITTASLIAYPGGEVSFRVKNVCAAGNGRGDSGRLGIHKDGRILSAKAGSAPPLDLNPNSSHGDSNEEILFGKRKRGYGAPAIPGVTVVRQAGRNTIRRAANAIGVEFGSERLAFITLTLPGSTPDSIRVFSEWQSHIQKRVAQYLKRNYSIGTEVYFVNKWEYQRRGALHSHILLALPIDEVEQEGKNHDLPMLQSKIRAFWTRVIRDLSARSGVDICARNGGGTWESSPEKWQIKVVRPLDVSRYLAKYVSKQNEERTTQNYQGNKYRMTRAWSASRGARKLLVSQTISYSAQLDPQHFDALVASANAASFDMTERSICVWNPYTNLAVGFHSYSENSKKLFENVRALISEFAIPATGKRDTKMVNHFANRTNNNRQFHYDQSDVDWRNFRGLPEEWQRTIERYWAAGCPKEWRWAKGTESQKVLADKLWREIKAPPFKAVVPEQTTMAIFEVGSDTGGRW